MHNRSLATTVRSAAAWALAAALAPSAFAELSIDTYPQVLVAGEGDNITFSCDDDDLMNAMGTGYAPRTATISVLDDDGKPSNVMKLQKVDENGNPTGAAGSSVTVNMYVISGGQTLGIPSGTVYVTGAMPGTANISYSIKGSFSLTQTVTINVVAPDDIKFRQTKTGEFVNNIVIAESDLQNSASFYLDFGYNLPDAINFTVANNAPAGTVDAPDSFRVTKGSSDFQYKFKALDGDRNFDFTFTGDAIYTDPMRIFISVTNVPPVLGSPSGTEDNPTPRTALQGSPTSFDARASDVSADATSMKYFWYQNGAQLYFDNNDNVVARNASTRDYSLSDTIAVVFNADGILSVMAQDKDGGVSRLGYWEVTLADSSTIKFTDEFTSAAITAGGGVGKAVFYTSATAEDFKDAALNPWRVDGNQFYADKSISVRAVPVAKDLVINGVTIADVPSYPFGWFTDDDSLIAASDLYVPNESVIPISITAPSAGSQATVRYLASNPYLGYYDQVTHELLDGYGDLDQDGLSDTWESKYFDVKDDQEPPSSMSWNTLAVFNSTGRYGMYGTSKNTTEDGETTDTPDNDRLPTAAKEVIENVWTNDLYYVANTGNLVRVYAYPLTGSYINYGTYIEDVTELATDNGILAYPDFEAVTGSTKEKAAKKPFFTNIEEFRGLEQATQAHSADWSAPNFVRVGYPGVLTGATRDRRGNSPGTDPTVNDTDGDGMTDGWEYYFWSTVLYENKPEFWRAYDPTFATYPELEPNGTADFRAVGIPLLRGEVDTNAVEMTWADGLYVRYPAETFPATIIRSDCYYIGAPYAARDGLEGLQHAPVCSFDYQEEVVSLDGAGTPVTNVVGRAAVEFTMGGFEAFTRAGFLDAHGRGRLFYAPHPGDSTPEEPVEIPGAYVDFCSGAFYLPGYDEYPEYIRTLIGARDATVSVRYRTANGLFPKQWILNKFDPNDELALSSNPDLAGTLKSYFGGTYNDIAWDPSQDLDNDGVLDIEEYYLGTNPLHWDTDGDGMPDGWEFIFGLDPHNPADGDDNPDCDAMYAYEGFRHVDAFLYVYENDVYWNGQTSLGFVPGQATVHPYFNHGSTNYWDTIPFTSREEFYTLKWMLGKDGKYGAYTAVVNPADWAVKSPSPRNDDTAPAIAAAPDQDCGDAIPDGWSLYVGYGLHPSEGYADQVNPMIDLIDYTWNRMGMADVPGPCPDNKRKDPDGDGLDWIHEFQNRHTGETRALQVERRSYLADKQEDGRYHDDSWYKMQNEDWTNKLLPTSPWLADTDGDGLEDGLEYKEGSVLGRPADWNGDRGGDNDKLVNLNPCSVDTDMDRLPDAWEFVSGLYDTVNAVYKPGTTNGVMAEFGPYGDPDGDGLPNYQEYLTGAVYGWRYDKWYAPDDETLWFPDVGMEAGLLAAACAADEMVAQSFSTNAIAGTDANVVVSIGGMDVDLTDMAGVPGGAILEDAFPYGKSVHFRKYRASDFFRPAASPKFVSDARRTIRRLEERWTNAIQYAESSRFGKAAAEAGMDAPTVAGWDTTYSPTMGEPETGANWYQRAWALLHDRNYRYLLDDGKDTPFITKEERDTLAKYLDVMRDDDPAAPKQGENALYGNPDFSYGCIPAKWEEQWKSGRDVTKVEGLQWSFMPNNYVGAAGFPGTMPRNPDTDSDGMDDYWEIFHGLNPTYGGSWVLAKGGGYPDADRADKHPFGNGSQQDWIMGADYTRVRNLQPTEEGFLPVMRAEGAFHTPLSGLTIASGAPFDYKMRPWLAGDPTADPDQDGLSNQEESYGESMNDVMHHTDPSPYWFTDTSYVESYVNLYYAVDPELSARRWWWAHDLFKSVGDGPSYLFDFEVNEGFDTDNDNVSDREEIAVDNGTGVTDPLDLDTPRARKALYLDGNAAARTRNPFFHDKWTLTSYTVEFWVRPEELPAAGKRATLIHRPVYMPVDDSSSATRYRIRDTFLVQIDDAGRVHARVDNDALETVSSASVVSAGRIVPGVWTHIALVMDSRADRLSLYIDENMAQSAANGLKPCTGFLNGIDYLIATNGLSGSVENLALYDYSPAPIVIGAYDRNPLGIVGGPYETNPWGLPFVTGQSQPDFDPDQYFRGWIDEVRIWDGARSQDEIVNAIGKRFGKDDIETINRKRFQWELDGWTPGGTGIGTNYLARTTSTEGVPQRLVYHYSFDNLPDVVPADDRADRLSKPELFALFSADASPSPLGWNDDAVARYRPTSFWTAPAWYPYAATALPHLVPWWYTAEHRSNRYTDYSYVPYIENTVAHMPQEPAVDMRGLVPNWNESEWTVTSYRRRSTFDWMNDALLGADDIVPALLPASGSLDVQKDRVRNTMNPYGMLYRTAVTYANEVHPAVFPGQLDRYGVYHNVPVLSDMLPLMDAVADIDVEMWDGNGRGTNVENVDTDGDGLPDWWELVNGLDPNDASGDNGRYADPDGDGLDNLTEYLAGTDPFAYDTDSDGYSDYFSRADGTSLTWGEMYDDGDGMPNDWEAKYGLDVDRYDALADKDSDGWTNWEEYMAGTDPTRADSYPEPKFNVTFDYNGKYAEQGELYAYSYSEKHAKTAYAASAVKDGEFISGTNYWGGAWDGKYFTRRLEAGVFGSSGREEFTFDPAAASYNGNYQYAQLTNSDVSVVIPPVLTVKANGAQTELTGNTWPYDSDWCAFSDDANMGTILLNLTTGKLIILRHGTSVLANDFRISYTTGSSAYPVFVKELKRADGQEKTQHMASGYNRFFGWLDLPDESGNYNAEFDVGEPAGVSQRRPTLVSWDAVDAEIPLTDELWGFPRVSWVDASAADPDHYEVTFEYQAGIVTNELSGALGDGDFDGLDDWGEGQAGTDPSDPDTGDTGYSDYYKVDPSTGLTYGELYDDGDGVPNAWERAVSVGRPVALDPDRYDATEDPDLDGWSNWEEYMAGTDPTDASQFPVPKLEFTFDYAGVATNAGNIVVQSYSAQTSGSGFGGRPDGVFENGGAIHYGTRVVDGSETAVISGSERLVNTYQGYKVASASITYTMGTNAPVTVEIPHSNNEYGYVTIAAEGDNAAGTGTFGVVWENGTVFAEGIAVGVPYELSVVIDGYNFPIVENNLIRRKGTHLVSGWNRFFGFIDANHNGEYDVGEPAGISTRRPSLVSYDTAQATIPLTDGLFGFPRFSWPTNNASENGYYTVVIVRLSQGSGANTKVAQVTIPKPRNFLHEGDLVSAGINGLPFGSSSSATFYWEVYDGTDISGSSSTKRIWPVDGDVTQNRFTYNYEGASSGDNTGSYSVNADTGRRTMQAIYPKDGETVRGPLVDFRWAMDHRNEGVSITIKNLDTGVTHIGGLVVPLPWRHGVAADGRMPVEYAGYYSACPQLEGKSSINELPSGRYSYTIEERVDSSAFTPQSVSGTFVLENDDVGQGRNAIKGSVYYWGRACTGTTFPAPVRIQAFALPEGAASAAAPSGNPVAQTTVSATGEFTLHGLSDGKYAVLAFLDQRNNTRADVWETQGYGVRRGTASPVFYATPEPLEVHGGDLEGVSIVLHPRDTDADGLADDWEWKKYGSLTAHTGTEASVLAAMAADPVAAPAGTPFFFPVGIDMDGIAGSLGLSIRPETFSKTFYVPAPRTFLHEGDFDDAGFYGFPMGLATNSVIRWTAYAVTPRDGDYAAIARAYTVGAGSFVEYAGPKGSRRAMKAGYPDQCTAILGTDVEFQWEMDYRSAGVEFLIERMDGDVTVTNADGSVTVLPYPRTFDSTTTPWGADSHPDASGATWTPVFSGIVPFPVRHGQKESADYYFTAIPQREDGRRHVDFAPGYYRYRITERPMTEAYRAQSVEGSFFVVPEDSDDPKGALAQVDKHTVSGTVFYYGKAMGGLDESTLLSSMTELGTLAGGETSIDLEYAGEVVRGSMVLQLVTNGVVAASANDRATTVATEGRFAVEGAHLWSAVIAYPEEGSGEPARLRLVFDPNDPPPAGSVVRMGVKAFGDDRKIVIQAFKLPDNATTSVSVSGHPVAQIERESKGAFEFGGLAQGKYAFRAFLDSNANGIPEEWETQGVGLLATTDSPVLSTAAGVIEVVSDVKNVRIILHDRDTDNDLLPDSWEYQMFGDISVADGRDRAPDDSTGMLKLWQEYADGQLDADPRTPDSDLDGLTDAMEIMVTLTNTESGDTDGDGVGDLEEFLSGSDPRDPSDAVPYTMPALAFDEDGAPYVDCPYPALPRGVVLTYVLQRKASLDDPEWEDVDEFEVAAIDAEPVAVADGVTLAAIPAGVGRMTPADKLDTLDWKSGFFRVRVFADYGKMVENGDGTCSFWAWTRSGEFAEVARGEGTLVRDADGSWTFVDEVTRKPGRLVRRDDGSWTFIRY